MIRIGENYRIRSDKSQWILDVRRVGKNPKTGDQAENWHQTYHPNIKQVSAKVVELEAREADSWSELIDKINQVESVLAEAIVKVEE